MEQVSHELVTAGTPVFLCTVKLVLHHHTLSSTNKAAHKDKPLEESFMVTSDKKA